MVLKVTMFCLSKGQFVDIKKGVWDEEDAKFRCLKRTLLIFYRRVGVAYAGASRDIFKSLSSKKSYVFIDVNGCESVNPDCILEMEKDFQKQMELDVISEREMYKNRMMILPLRYIIVTFFGGMGFYSFLRTVFSSRGIVLP